MAEPKFIGKVKLTRQGQLTLPNEARQHLGIGPEAELFWYEMNGCMVLTTELQNQKDVARRLKK